MFLCVAQLAEGWDLESHKVEKCLRGGGWGFAATHKAEVFLPSALGMPRKVWGQLSSEGSEARPVLAQTELQGLWWETFLC